MKNRDIIITWQVEDGYAGGAAPQTFTIPREEWDECETEEEREELVEDCMREDFAEKVSYGETSREVPE